MEYYVYTDGSCKTASHIAGSAFIILTKKNYIKCDCESFYSRFAFEAELNAAIMAFRYINEKLELTEDDNIIIYIDSVKTINLCNSIINKCGSIDKHVPLFSETDKQLNMLLSKCPNLEIKKVHAHQQTFNTNKMVDSLAKVAIQHIPVKV